MYRVILVSVVTLHSRIGVVSNLSVAGSCIMRTTLPKSDLAIHVPELLRGQLSINQNVIQAVFDEPLTRAKLRFRSKILMRNWRVRSRGVFSELNYIGLAIITQDGRNSCIKATLN